MTTINTSGVELSLTWTDTRTNAARSYSGPLPVSIGRDHGSSIVLSNLLVSRRHARLEYECGELVVVDLQSRTGVLVNGQAVERAILRPGDSFTIGPFAFHLITSSAHGPVRRSARPGRPRRAIRLVSANSCSTRRPAPKNRGRRPVSGARRRGAGVARRAQSLF